MEPVASSTRAEVTKTRRAPRRYRRNPCSARTSRRTPRTTTVSLGRTSRTGTMTRRSSCRCGKKKRRSRTVRMCRRASPRATGPRTVGSSVTGVRRSIAASYRACAPGRMHPVRNLWRPRDGVELPEAGAAGDRARRDGDPALEDRDLAPAPKKGARLKATLAFLDES